MRLRSDAASRMGASPLILHWKYQIIQKKVLFWKSGILFNFSYHFPYLKESSWPIGAGCSSCVALLCGATLFLSASQTPEREAPTSKRRSGAVAMPASTMAYQYTHRARKRNKRKPHYLNYISCPLDNDTGPMVLKNNTWAVDRHLIGLFWKPTN